MRQTEMALCRKTGRLRDLIGHLLELNRVQEASDEARQASDYKLITLSQDIYDAGHPDMAEELLWSRSETTRDTRLLNQLLQWVRERQDPWAALMLANQIVQLQGQLVHYRQLREIAQDAGQWPLVESELLERLAAENKFDLIIEIHLEENRVGDALAVLRAADQANRDTYYPYSVSLRLNVAHATEARHPEAAIDIYLAEANRLIRARGRPNYAEAARHLKHVRELLKGLGKEERWEALIARIQDENRRLRALRKE